MPNGWDQMFEFLGTVNQHRDAIRGKCFQSNRNGRIETRLVTDLKVLRGDVVYLTGPNLKIERTASWSEWDVWRATAEEIVK